MTSQPYTQAGTGRHFLKIFSPILLSSALTLMLPLIAWAISTTTRNTATIDSITFNPFIVGSQLCFLIALALVVNTVMTFSVVMACLRYMRDVIEAEEGRA